jgi:hypothetical protein
MKKSELRIIIKEELLKEKPVFRRPKSTMHKTDGATVVITGGYPSEVQQELADKIMKQVKKALDGYSKISNIEINF